MDQRRLWKYADVAEFIGCTERHVRNLIRKHGLPYLRAGARSVRFDPEHVMAWVRQRHDVNGGGLD